MPVFKSCASSAVYENQIWIMGGRDESGSIADDVWSFNPDSQKWTSKPSLPQPLMLSSAITINDRIFLVGGMSGSKENPKVINEIYTFNNSSQDWEIWTRMSHSRMNHSTGAYGHLLIIAGGHTMDNLVPKEVPEAVCLDTSSLEPVEHTSPLIGSSRIGLGISMYGDPHIIDRVCSRDKSFMSSYLPSHSHSVHTDLE